MWDDFIYNMPSHLWKIGLKFFLSWSTKFFIKQVGIFCHDKNICNVWTWWLQLCIRCHNMSVFAPLLLNRSKITGKNFESKILEKRIKLWSTSPKNTDSANSICMKLVTAYYITIWQSNVLWFVHLLKIYNRLIKNYII